MAEENEPNVQSNEPVIADKTTDVEVEDPAGGQSLSYRIVEGQPVPPHLVEAYKASGSKGGKSKKVDGPDKDK